MWTVRRVWQRILSWYGPGKVSIGDAGMWPLPQEVLDAKADK